MSIKTIYYIVKCTEPVVTSKEEIQGKSTFRKILPRTENASNSSEKQTQDSENKFQNFVAEDVGTAQDGSHTGNTNPECEICGCEVSNLSGLLEHQKIHHPAYWQLYKQNFSSIFRQKKKLKKQEKNHECDICHKLFLRQNTLLKHKEIIHKEMWVTNKDGQEPSSLWPTSSASVIKHSCHVCGKSFQTTSGFRHHQKQSHGIVPDYKRQLKCSGCLSSFPSKELFINHLEQKHKLTVNIEKQEFESIEEFKKWKRDIEKDTVAKYIVHYKHKLKAGLETTCYTCHRNGCYVSTSTGKRRPKLIGTNKIEFFCPAGIVLQAKQAEKSFPAEVTFTSLHLGHKCEIERLKLSKQEKDQILTERKQSEQLLYGDIDL